VSRESYEVANLIRNRRSAIWSRCGAGIDSITERRLRNAEFSEAAYDAPLHYSLGIRECHTTIAREWGHGGANPKPLRDTVNHSQKQATARDGRDDDVKGRRDARQTLPQSRAQVVNPCRASLRAECGIRPRRHEGVAKAHR
jgi:hypothetical protein